jgi:hypothetical protein
MAWKLGIKKSNLSPTSTKGADNLARLGFNVKELLGGLNWWKRDGGIPPKEDVVPKVRKLHVVVKSY